MSWPSKQVLQVHHHFVSHTGASWHVDIVKWWPCVQGGDWILQERMTNSKFIASLLPEDAPLSTLRVITGSRRWLMQQGSAGQQAAAGGVEVMTVVFRAGEAQCLLWVMACKGCACAATKPWL
jgi:hypothetical protein